MTNTERQRSLDAMRVREYGDVTACGHDNYCDYCKESELNDDNCCAKAYNRMVREKKQ